MAQPKNNQFRLICIGSLAFSLVAIVVFVALGGGSDAENDDERVEGFNNELPSANVVLVSDDRIQAAKLEEEKRKRDEMMGISGSTFQLLEVEEDQPKEDLDSLAKSMEGQTREELERQVASCKAEVVASSKTTLAENTDVADLQRVDRSEYKKKRQQESYKTMQSIYGTELFPDAEENESNQVERKSNVTSNVTPTAEEKPSKKVGFNTLNSKSSVSVHDIRAVVHGTHKDLTTNSQVKLRLLDPLTIGSVTIPRNSFVYGRVSFSEARLLISIENVNYENSVLPFKGEIFDKDGSRGIYVPDNAVNESAKEEGNTLVSGSSLSVTGGKGTLSGMASSAVNGTVNTIKNAVVKSVNKNKVTISENYIVTIRESRK